MKYPKIIITIILVLGLAIGTTIFTTSCSNPVVSDHTEVEDPANDDPADDDPADDDPTDDDPADDDPADDDPADDDPSDDDPADDDDDPADDDPADDDPVDNGDSVEDPNSASFYSSHPDVSSDVTNVNDYSVLGTTAGEPSVFRVRVYTEHTRTVLLRVEVNEVSKVIEHHASVGFSWSENISISTSVDSAGWQNIMITIMEPNGNIITHDATSYWVRYY